MTRRTRTVLATASTLPLIAAVYAGGWATITVDELPEHIVAGERVDLSFTLRQHGMHLASDLQPSVHATNGSTTLKVPVRQTAKAGQYSAALTVNEAAPWRIAIHSGLGESKVSLLPLLAIRPGAAAPAPLAAFERGHHLFVAKGCVSCHAHRDVKGSGQVEVGPDLTGRRFPADYLARFLADPSITPPRGDAKMPDLELNAREIAALVAFINGDAPRHAATGTLR